MRAVLRTGLCGNPNPLLIFLSCGWILKGVSQSDMSGEFCGVCQVNDVNTNCSSYSVAHCWPVNSNITPLAAAGPAHRGYRVNQNKLPPSLFTTGHRCFRLSDQYENLPAQYLNVLMCPQVGDSVVKNDRIKFKDVCPTRYKFVSSNIQEDTYLSIMFMGTSSGNKKI